MAQCQQSTGGVSHETPEIAPLQAGEAEEQTHRGPDGKHEAAQRQGELGMFGDKVEAVQNLFFAESIRVRAANF